MKERFISEQVKTLSDMQNNLNTLIEHKNVVSVASQVIATALAAGAEVGGDDSKSKLEINIQMQDLEGHQQNEGENRLTEQNNVEEAKQPLIQKQEATPMLQGIPHTGMIAISYLAGTINKDEIMRFKKMVYRATRGKALTYFNDMDSAGLQDYSGALDRRARTVYVIVFQDGLHIRDKLVRICDSFLGKNFDIPQGGNQQEIVERISELERRIQDARLLIK